MLSDSGGIFQSDYRGYAKAYLASNDITIDAKIPKYSKNAGKIVYTAKEYQIPKIYELVFEKEAPPIVDDLIDIELGTKKLKLSNEELFIVGEIPNGENVFSNTNKLESELYRYLRKLGYKKINLKGGIVEESDTFKKFEYIVEFKRASIFDLTLRARIDNDGILTLSVPTREVKKENGQNEVLSPYQVLVMAQLPTGTRINRIDFGYKQLFQGDLYGNPLWKVALSNGKTVYYNAYTGEEL